MSQVETRRINTIQSGDRCRKELGDVSSLAASMKNVGLLHFPIVTPDGGLVAGERRLKAALWLGWQEIPCHVVTNLGEAAKLLEAERDENLERKALTPEEATRLADKLLDLEEPAAQEREREAGKEGGKKAGRGRPTTDRGGGNSPTPIEKEHGRAKARAAKAAGMDRRTYEKAKAVRDAADKEPGRFGDLRDEMNRTGKVNGAFKKMERLNQTEKINSEPPPLPKGPFRVIVVDPPWKYDNREDDPAHRASNPYPSMALEDIEALKVEELAHKDCILWLWTTNSHLPLAFPLLEKWGFTYKTILTWVKNKMGTGDWLRGKTEHCLLAVRGKPVVNLTNQTTALEGAAREHSRKPEEFYQLVETLCPGSKVELFAREKRNGWVQHGDQTNLF